MKMKRWWAGLVFLMGVVAVQALEMRLGEKEYMLPAGSSLPEQSFLHASRIRLEGVCAEDVYAVGREIAFTGRALRPLWMMAQSGVVDGDAEDDVRALAVDSLAVRGHVRRNLGAIASRVSLMPSSRIDGEAVLVADHVLVQGVVSGKLYAVANKVTLDGLFYGRLRVIAREIIVMPGTRIDGDLVYTSPKELFLPNQVKVSGRLVRADLDLDINLSPPNPQQMVLLQMYFFLAAWMAGLVAVAVFPRFMTHAAHWGTRSPMACALAGVAVLLGLPMATIAAAFTIIGIPLALMLAGWYFLLVYASKFVVALMLGALIFRRGTPSFTHTVMVMSTGLLAVYIAIGVPVVGPWAGMAVQLLGAGALVSTLFRGPRTS
jgi:cytoskeletal protein CcmA (bactofilin family)